MKFLYCRGNYFEDGNDVYRFLEHEQFVSKSFNFRGSIDDKEPESAAMIGEKLMKIMSAILESYASEDRCCLDYLAISNSEEFRRHNFFNCIIIFICSTVLLKSH